MKFLSTSLCIAQHDHDVALVAKVVSSKPG